MSGREIFADTYNSQWVQVDTESGEIEELAFTASIEHEHYLPPMPLEETSKLVFSGKGYRGNCLDYVRHTVEILQQLGLRDQDLERILSFPETQAHPTTGLHTS